MVRRLSAAVYLPNCRHDTHGRRTTIDGSSPLWPSRQRRSGVPANRLRGPTPDAPAASTRPAPTRVASIYTPVLRRREQRRTVGLLLAGPCGPTPTTLRCVARSDASLLPSSADPPPGSRGATATPRPPMPLVGPCCAPGCRQPALRARAGPACLAGSCPGQGPWAPPRAVTIDSADSGGSPLDLCHPTSWGTLLYHAATCRVDLLGSAARRRRPGAGALAAASPSPPNSPGSVNPPRGGATAPRCHRARGPSRLVVDGLGQGP
jgi:hypothetical protein